VFIVAKLVGTDNILEPELSLAQYGGDRRDYQMLSWDQVHALMDSGWTVGSHTMTHSWLTRVVADRVRWEVAESRIVIERQIGRPVEFFCYPAGRLNADIVEEVQRAGYRGAVVTPRERGCAESAYTLRRVGIYGHDSLATFRLKLSRTFTVLREMPFLWSLGTGLSRLRRQLRGE
jgi:peptidoglycan/xylan/chitin deacetylase (PgdA/CDA1 family)